jgi:hypothetical protein
VHLPVAGVLSRLEIGDERVASADDAGLEQVGGVVPLDVVREAREGALVIAAVEVRLTAPMRLDEGVEEAHSTGMPCRIVFSETTCGSTNWSR